MKNPRVTVAVVAHNEAGNIRPFLLSVLHQRGIGFQLEKVLVYSDGSTDETVSIVNSLKCPKIRLIARSRRIGKSSRLNRIYRSNASDILVQSDADVVFAHPLVVHDLIQPLITDPHVLMCGGNPTPIAGRTFTEKAVNCTTQAFEQFRQRVRGGNNVFSADGRLLAFRREFAQKIEIPSSMIANDMFAYFSCLTAEGEYRYASTAVVYFRSPQTLMDHIRQNTRFLAARRRMEQYFPKHLVDDELRIPLNLTIKTLMKQFFRHPVLTSYIFLVNRFCAFRAKLVEHTLDARWPLAQSTKLLYANEHE